MGDFDRVQKLEASGPGADETRKVLMVVVLGAVLLVVVGWQMMKRGPQPATAAVGTTNVAGMDLPMVQDSPESLAKSLAADPTAKLLQENGPPAAPKPLRNPFRMDDAWRRDLTRVEPTPVAQTRPRPVADTRPVEPTLPPPPKGLRSEDYKLSGILNGNDGMVAVLNGTIVHVGSVVKDARILEIHADNVVLQHSGFSDGPRLTLVLNRQP